MINRFKKFSFLLKQAFRAKAFLTFLDFIIYRTPFAYRWSRLCGYDFHKSTIVWIKEEKGVHTRLTLLLPRFMFELPQMKTLDMEFELYRDNGEFVKKWEIKNISVEKEFVLDSKHYPDIPRPFYGSLWIKQRLHVDEPLFFKWAKGLFSVANTYVEYYSEGSFITVTHDYSAFLPDQGIHFKPVGLIPAYCDDECETHFVIHAAKGGIKAADIEVTLFNKRGEEQMVRLPALKPFAMRRVFISELFPNAKEFLKEGVGQLELKGIFRHLFARVAYGVVNKKTESFSFDHCFYSVFKHAYISNEDRRRFPKGYFNPFFILEDGGISTSIILFHKSEYPYEKNIDLLVYDEKGSCIIRLPSYLCLRGNATEKINLKPILEKFGISGRFMGHGEILYHQSLKYTSYPNYLDIIAEYRSGDHFANVVFGSKLWNKADELDLKPRDLHGFGCRVVCNDAQTTYLAISNCSHDYNYRLNVRFDLDLIVNGQVVEHRTMSIQPEGTLYHSVEEFFPNARKHLERSGGIGILSYTILNSSLLATAFLTVDRKSRALSIEHTLEVPNFSRADLSH